MGVLLKGVNMPQNCYECPCAYVADHTEDFCSVCERKIFGYEYNRPTWCPIVEICESCGNEITGMNCCPNCGRKNKGGN